MSVVGLTSFCSKYIQLPEVCHLSMSAWCSATILSFINVEQDLHALDLACETWADPPSAL